MKRLLGTALIAVSLVGCSKEVKKVEVTPPTPAPVEEPAKVEEVKEEEVPEVIDTDKDTVKEESVAEVVVESKTTVPDIRGKALDVATKELNDLGLKVGVILYEFDNKPVNTILAQSGIGNSVSKGHKVNIIVSKGTKMGPTSPPQEETKKPNTEGEVEVPNIIGMEKDKAVELTTRLGIKMASFGYVEPTSKVAWQSPAPGTMVDYNSFLNYSDK